MVLIQKLIFYSVEEPGILKQDGKGIQNMSGVYLIALVKNFLRWTLRHPRLGQWPRPSVSTVAPSA